MILSWSITNTNIYKSIYRSYSSIVSSKTIDSTTNIACGTPLKMHGVLPSSRWYSASLRRIQFYRVHVGDNRAVVTPFVQVTTYATRNFTTLRQFLEFNITMNNLLSSYMMNLLLKVVHLG